ncbi:Flagellin-specific chaperone FliS [Fodinibius sediminis]|uniref:Flagellin-specific chaperone FliS n=2 Tax=Fodinibius sediminis TaxID=1214077 RepID=A0A521CLD3_9BACT|nr:Flagellin-specific chaperone FliS [Fodinibius sediminis]
MENPQIKYQRQAIKNASPTELISKLYDFAIQACYQEDGERLNRVLETLIQSLNYDYEIAGELYGLYEYCQRLARQKEFDEVRELLEPIREAWEESVVKDKQETVNQGGRGFVV